MEGSEVTRNRRIWWGGCALLVGVGAALLSGAGIAAAQTGTPCPHPETSAADSAPTRTAAVKPIPRAAAAAGTAVKSKTAVEPAASRLKIDAEAPKAGATPRTVTAHLWSESAAKVLAALAPYTRMVPQVTATVSGGATVAHTPGPPAKATLDSLVPAVALGSATNTVSGPGTNGVTGVKKGFSFLDIPVGSRGYLAPTHWFFPTQADGSVQANGVIYLQHGFGAVGVLYSDLASQLAQQTDSIVVVPTLSSLPLPFCRGCWLNGTQMQQGVASLFLGSQAALNISASAAGYQGTLPKNFLLTGHSAGGGLATAAAGDYVADLGPAPTDNHLVGVVMFDGVASSSSGFAAAIANLKTLSIPDYVVAAPPQAWNAFGATTNALVSLYPGQFVGTELVGGSHVDSLLGGFPVIDFIAQLITRFSPRGNTAAVYTLATGWINDMYAGRGPTDPEYGIYGTAGQAIILGQATGIVLPVQPTAAKLLA